MSLFADYHKEQGVKHVIESDSGFAVYWKLETETCIGDMYVIPSKRHTGLANQMLNSIETQAKEWGCKFLSCSSIPQAAGSQISQKVIISLGFKLYKESPECKWFIKEVK